MVLIVLLPVSGCVLDLDTVICYRQMHDAVVTGTSFVMCFVIISEATRS